MKKLIIAAGLLIVAISACKKEETKNSTVDQSAKSKAVQLLVANNWKSDSIAYTNNGEREVEYPQTCEMDNYVTFKMDGKQVYSFGTIKCDELEPASQVFNYSVSANADSIFISDAVDRYAYKIKTLQSGKFILTSQTGVYLEEIYFSKK